jgi:hypothetical protein
VGNDDGLVAAGGIAAIPGRGRRVGDDRFCQTFNGSLRGALAVDNPFEKTVARQTVGAVQAGAGDFTDGEEIDDVALPPAVDLDAAAEIVGGRDDGDRFRGDVDAVVQAGFVDGREAFLDVGGVLVGDITPVSTPDRTR